LSEETEKTVQKAEKLPFRAEAFDWLQSIICAFVAGIFIFIFIARVVRVDGSSMYATLHNNDLVITSKLFYTPHTGDIVVFRTDGYGDEPLVKRIIAKGGQTVDIDFTAGIVYVDGVALDEPYTNTLTNVRENFDGEVTVPEGCLFVMGDNRNASRDSRSYSVGFVDERQIVGKVLFVLIPGSNDGEKADWSRFGSVYR